MNLNFEKASETIWKTVIIGDTEIDTKKVDNSKKIDEFDIVSTNSLVNFLFLQFLFGHRYFFFGCRLIFLRRILFFRLIRSLSFVVFAFFLCFHLIGFFHFFYCIPSSLEFCSFWRELFFVLILVLFEKLVYLTIMI